MEASETDTRSSAGLWVILLGLLGTVVLGGLFYYSLKQTTRYQAEVGPLMKTRFLQTLLAREGQPQWRATENETLSLNSDAWTFSVHGHELQIAVQSAVPLENQASLIGEITKTVRQVLSLDPSNTEIHVNFPIGASNHK